MARLDTNQLIRQATDIGYRIDHVQRDPAVRKAWADARSDTARAMSSISRAAWETRAAWSRTQPAGTGAATA